MVSPPKFYEFTNVVMDKILVSCDFHGFWTCHSRIILTFYLCDFYRDIKAIKW